MWNHDVRRLGGCGRRKSVLEEQEDVGDVWWRCLAEALPLCQLFQPLLLLCRLESSKLHGGLYRRDNKPCETTQGLLLCFVTTWPTLESLQETAGAPFLANGVPAFLFLPALGWQQPAAPGEALRGCSPGAGTCAQHCAAILVHFVTLLLVNICGDSQHPTEPPWGAPRAQEAAATCSKTKFTAQVCCKLAAGLFPTS